MYCLEFRLSRCTMWRKRNGRIRKGSLHQPQASWNQRANLRRSSQRRDLPRKKRQNEISWLEQFQEACRVLDQVLQVCLLGTTVLYKIILFSGRKLHNLLYWLSHDVSLFRIHMQSLLIWFWIFELKLRMIHSKIQPQWVNI